MTVIAFPLSRCRPPGYGPLHHGRVIQFPSSAAPAVTGATRAEIAALVAEVANAMGTTAHEVNLILLRRGHPRRAKCTQTDLDLIREDLRWELQRRMIPQTASR